MRDIQAMVTDLNHDCNNGTLPDQTAPIGFSCPICREVYHTLQEAMVCRDQPYDDGGLKVGNIIVIPGVCHHKILDDPWLAFVIPSDPESSSHFDRAGYWVPFFVVTAVHAEPRRQHQCIVTVASLCDGALTIGWNPANGEGHYEIFKLTGKRNRGGHNDFWIDRMPDLTKCVVPEQVKEEAAALAAMKLSTRNLL